MGRLGANVSGLAYSYAEYAPYGSLRIQFPCHPAKAGVLWMLSIVPHDTRGKRRGGILPPPE